LKLEFFADAFEGSGLLLLYSGSPSEVERLRGTLSELAVPGTSVRVHALDFVDAVNSCELTFYAAKRGSGVYARTGVPRFELELAPSEWDRVSGLLESFCNPELEATGARFQYLHEYDGVEVIYSTDRQW
jgi:hypothetical protein